LLPNGEACGVVVAGASADLAPKADPPKVEGPVVPPNAGVVVVLVLLVPKAEKPPNGDA